MTRSAVKGIVALVTAASLWILVLPVGAASLEASGWWWRPQTGLGGIQAPAPPDVSEGNLLVESTPQETTAVAAVRFTLRSDEVQPILKLQVAEAANAGNAELAACPAGAKWQEAHAGRWDDKPPAACAEGSVSGVAADDGSEWTFPVSALVPLFLEGTIDVVIVPGRTETGGNPSFRIVFEEPTSRSLETTREAPEVSVPPAEGFGDPDPTPATTDDSGSTGTGGGTSAGPSTPSEPGPTPEPVFDPALDAEDQEVTSSAPLPRVGTASVPTERPGRWTAVVVLALGAAAAFWLFQQPLPAPRRLGPMAARHAADEPAPDEPDEGSEVRGIGRFRRPRSGEPPKL